MIRGSPHTLLSLTALVSRLHHLHVSRRVVSLDVGVDGFLHQALLELSLGQLAPHGRLVAALGELVRPVQVTDVLNQNLRGKGKRSVAASGLQG